jgi:hypothetical protein
VIKKPGVEYYVAMNVAKREKAPSSFAALYRRAL